MNITELEAMIAHIEGQLKPLLREKQRLESSLRTAKSVEFIRVNKIKKTDVQRRDPEFCDGVWHGYLSAFGEWMKSTNCRKPWCEWNGMLHRTLDIIDGRMPNSCAEYDDVKE